MPHIVVDGLRMHYRSSGRGDPVVLVHGSWDDHRSWDLVVPHLAPRRHVVRYDRRGHGRSECPPGQGRIDEDVGDLAGIIEHLELGPAHIVGHSYGATIALLLALRHPGLCRSLTVHEPPVLALLADSDPELLAEVQRRMRQVVELIGQDEIEIATRMFVEDVGFGPGTWDHVLTPDLRETFIAHAHTWLDQARDPDRLSVAADQLAGISVPTLVTHGNRGLPWYGPVVRLVAQSIPGSRTHTIAGCGHAPHLTHSGEFASAVSDHTDAHNTGSGENA